jgi:hypothetical protein
MAGTIGIHASASARGDNWKMTGTFLHKCLSSVLRWVNKEILLELIKQLAGDPKLISYTPFYSMEKSGKNKVSMYLFTDTFHSRVWIPLAVLNIHTLKKKKGREEV